MNMLIIGCGAREHAIAMALHRSPQKPNIYCIGASLNPGIEQMALHYALGDVNNTRFVSQLAKDWQINIAIIGPESPLEQGVADALWKIAIPTIGPKKKLAQIETSKRFARELMKKYHIPGLPNYQTFKAEANEVSEIKHFLNTLGEGNYVVKANGLMSGKGVKVAGEHLNSIDEAIKFCQEIIRRNQDIVIEEKLIGQEFSLMCFCDGENIIPMPIVQDHKRAYVNDEGPNTGGMGSYSAANHSLPFLSHHDVKTAHEINEAVIKALTQEMNDKYVGILYGSFIATKDGVYVIEFNARFGDPESLNVLTILETDFAYICQNLVTGNLKPNTIVFSKKATVCKYAVPEGYPDNPLKNIPIDICAVKNKSQLYLAAVNTENGKIIATGSRAAAYVGVADTISQAEEIAEREVKAIKGQLFHREDIGTDQLIQKRIDAMRHLREGKSCV